MTRQQLAQMIAEEMKEIHNRRVLRPDLEPIDKQCHDRFSMSWNETRVRVFRDLDAMELWNTHIDDIAHHGTTGNWMINILVRLWVLIKRARQVEVPKPENWHGFGGRLDMERVLEDVLAGKREPNQHTLYYIAPVLCPELVLNVIESHGLSI